MTYRTSTTRWPEAFALVAAALLAGCGGSSRGTATEQRPTDAFHSVELRGAAEVTVEVGPASSLTLTGSPDALREVETSVLNGMLHIDRKRHWYEFGGGGRLKLHITAPDLNAFAVQGAGDVDIRGVTGDAFAVVLSGAGEVSATGSVQALNARINGAGKMDLSGLTAVDATVYLNGAGELTVNVTGSLEAELNGVGNIRYAGNPQKVEPQINGVGRIAAIDTPAGTP